MSNLQATWRRRLDPEGRYGLRLTLFATAFFLVAVPFGWLLEQVVGDGWLVRVDTSAARHLHSWVESSPGTVRGLKALTFLGAPVLFYVLVPLVGLLLWRRHYPRLALFLVVTVATGGLLDTVVKMAVSRSRPSLLEPVATASGKSFPSGHAMSSTIVYGSLLLVFLPWIARRRRVAVVIAAVVIVLAIGFSRLALGVHYISDVVGGYVLGLAWLGASAAAFSIWRVEQAKPAVEPLEGLEPEAAGEVPMSPAPDVLERSEHAPGPSSGDAERSDKLPANMTQPRRHGSGSGDHDRWMA